jgi:uncharacterized protein YgbK (DUF1537 family)
VGIFLRLALALKSGNFGDEDFFLPPRSTHYESGE